MTINARVIRQTDAIDEGDAIRLVFESLDVDMTGATLPQLQGIVGGNVDCFDIEHPDSGALATVWFHDEGKVIDLPRNHVAEFFATMGGWPGLEWGDWIAGPVVFTGFDPAEGETITLPEEWGEVIDRVRIKGAEA